MTFNQSSGSRRVLQHVVVVHERREPAADDERRQPIAELIDIVRFVVQTEPLVNQVQSSVVT